MFYLLLRWLHSGSSRMGRTARQCLGQTGRAARHGGRTAHCPAWALLPGRRGDAQGRPCPGVCESALCPVTAALVQGDGGRRAGKGRMGSLCHEFLHNHRSENELEQAGTGGGGVCSEKHCGGKKTENCLTGCFKYLLVLETVNKWKFISNHSCL